MPHILTPAAAHGHCDAHAAQHSTAHTHMITNRTLHKSVRALAARASRVAVVYRGRSELDNEEGGCTRVTRDEDGSEEQSGALHT